jgi:hypothetical protein
MRKVKVLLTKITSARVESYLLEVTVYSSGIYDIESVSWSGVGATRLAKEELFRSLPKYVFDQVLQSPRGGKSGDWSWSERR